ncbi:MAG: hypothetical protein WKF84_17585 [Pyrinomonadaceae bacterium]
MEKLSVVLTLLLVLIAHGAAQIRRSRTSVPLPIRYDLNIRVLPDTRRLEATGMMQLPASNTPRSELRLSLSELMRDFTVEVLEPATSAGIAKVESRDASGRNVKWIVHLLRPVPAGETVRLRFSYAGGERIANQFCIGSEVSFASAWGTDSVSVA